MNVRTLFMVNARSIYLSEAILLLVLFFHEFSIQFNSKMQWTKQTRIPYYFLRFFFGFSSLLWRINFLYSKKIMRFYRNNIWLIHRMLLCTEIRVDKQSNRARFYRYLDIPLKCILMSSQILSYRWIKPQR